MILVFCLFASSGAVQYVEVEAMILVVCLFASSGAVQYVEVEAMILVFCLFASSGDVQYVEVEASDESLHCRCPPWARNPTDGGHFLELKR